MAPTLRDARAVHRCRRGRPAGDTDALSGVVVPSRGRTNQGHRVSGRTDAWRRNRPGP
jgi:hypothetical protein